MLYHNTMGIPFELNLPETLDLHYSKHARRAAENDRYGQIRLKPSLQVANAEVVEIEVCDRTGEPIKVLLRKPYSEDLDICLAIALDSAMDGAFFVKTVWLNESTDNHQTLRRGAYKQVS